MGLVTFRVRTLDMSEEQFDAIRSGYISKADLKNPSYSYKMKTFRSEEIETIEAFDIDKTVINFYERDPELVKLPHREAKRRWEKAVKEEFGPLDENTRSSVEKEEEDE